MIELQIVSTKLATRLFKLGIETLPPRIVDGVKVFVFRYGPGQAAKVNQVFKERDR